MQPSSFHLEILTIAFVDLTKLRRAESDGVICLEAGITSEQSSSAAFVVSIDVGVGTVVL